MFLYITLMSLISVIDKVKQNKCKHMHSRPGSYKTVVPGDVWLRMWSHKPAKLVFLQLWIARASCFGKIHAFR